MLNFSEEFYKDEEREDFFVSQTMKRYWACLLDMLHVIDGICKKHNIAYYAAYGSMLGAVRHKGFIPWDDDIDLMVKRPDYERLMEILPQEMPESWWISNCFNNENHRQFYAGLSNGRELDLSKEHMNQYHQCPFVATIDIFPLDYLPRDPKEAAVVKELFLIIWEAIELVKQEVSDKEIIERAVRNVEYYCGVDVDRSKPLRSQLWRLANYLVMSYQEDEGDCLVQWCSHINRKGKYMFKKELFDAAEYLAFENTTIPVPVGYEEILKITYGDWQKRVQFTGAHNYPAFKNQLEFLKRKVAEMKAEAGEET